ncbi:hypothetical protein PMAYCL1PPCAC_05737, partial [Pristionchus mayeri]
RIRASPVLFFALACYGLVYLYSYPWPHISEPIVIMNEGNVFCILLSHTRLVILPCQVKVWYWLPVITTLFGFAVPTSMVSIDTVYSKLLGNIDQNLMQGALVLVDDIASSVAPIVTMEIYTAHGPSVFWLVLAGTALVGLIAWLPMIQKMRRLKI